jgi:hypothetical protein
MKRLSVLAVVIFVCVSVVHSAARVEVGPGRSYPSRSVPGRLKISELPKKNGKIDAERILIDSTFAKQGVVSGLSKPQRQQLSAIVGLLKKNQLNPASERFGALLQSIKDQKIPADIDELMLYIIRESFTETNEDLMFFASRLKHFNEISKTISEHIRELVQIQRESSKGNCSMQVISSVSALIRDWEEELSSVGDDAQLANIDLQNALQKQQQLLQMLSNISKVLHDTAMGVIRNIR